MATLIIGARRVGKSVITYQLIDHLLKNGVHGKNIFFIQGDNPILVEAYSGKRFLYAILQIYESVFLGKKFADSEETIYIFVDEAQNIPEWEVDIKSLIDLKYNIKFIVTGSSSSDLKRGSQNPLTGRVNLQVLSPFSFSDFVRYSIDQEETKEEFNQIINKAHNEFVQILLAGSHIDAYEVADKLIKAIDKFKVKSKFEDYLFLGGFPSVLKHFNTIETQKYLRDLMTTTISKDIMSQADIREPQAFERLLVNISLLAGKTISFKALSDILGIDSRIVSRYVDYYCEIHWVSISSPFYFHKKPDSIKSTKKVYVIDTGIINTLSFKDKDDITKDKAYAGQLIENVLYNHLLNFKQIIGGSFQAQIPYFTDVKSGKEIDFILEVKNKVIPIESKAKKMPDDDEIETLQNFIKEKSSTKFGIITTENTIEIREKLLLIPYYLLTLLL